MMRLCKILTISASLSPALVLAHPGHVDAATVHSMLHAEHLSILALVFAIAALLKLVFKD